MKTIFAAAAARPRSRRLPDLSPGPLWPGPLGYPEPAPFPAIREQGDYRAIGTEPFWDLTIGRDLVFTDRGNNISVAEPAPPVRRGVAGESYHGRRGCA